MKTADESPLEVKKIRVGRMDENCYVLFDTVSRHAVIIDPGDEGNFIAEQLQAIGAVPTAILATHGHFDHILGARELQMIYSIPFCIHEADVFLVKRMKETAEYFLEHMIVESPPEVSRLLTDTDSIQLGDQKISVIPVPGHTPGSVCYYIRAHNMLFVGDTIFAGGAVGRTDFSYSDAKELGHSIRTILSLPDETVVYPGHGADTTIKTEKNYQII